MRKTLICCVLLVLSALFCGGVSGCSDNQTDALSVSCPALGKADGFLFTEGDCAFLLDCGEAEDAETLLNLMYRHDITHLDAIILSHYDKDHIGGAAEILRAVGVDCVYCTNFSEESEAYSALQCALTETNTPVTLVTDTMTATFNSVTVTLYPPLKASYEKDEDNNASLIAAVHSNGAELLFTGDAMKERVTEFLDTQYDGTAYDLIKLPHHGKEKKPASLLVDAISPAQVLLTASDEEPESEKLTAYLEKTGCRIFNTREGDVFITYADDSIQTEYRSLN